ncbi:integrin alpha-M-like, partial [Mustelus asterias]
NCIGDYYNPIELTTRYCAEGVPIASRKNLKPTLKERCSTDLLTLLPFEKNCGTDGVCISDLQLEFNSTGFIVHSGAQFNLSVSLSNVREDSYHTNVEFRHPLGISFRKVTVLKSDRKIPIACDDTLTHEDFGLTNCRISHPVFPENRKVLFVLTLDVSNSDDWDHSILVNVSAISENEDTATLENNRAYLQIPVRYRVNLLVGSSLSTSYVNISLGSQKEKEVIHRFQVKNLSKRPLPVNVTFMAPKRLGHGIVWHIPGVVPLQ